MKKLALFETRAGRLFHVVVPGTTMLCSAYTLSLPVPVTVHWKPFGSFIPVSEHSSSSHRVALGGGITNLWCQFEVDGTVGKAIGGDIKANEGDGLVSGSGAGEVDPSSELSVVCRVRRVLLRRNEVVRELIRGQLTCLLPSHEEQQTSTVLAVAVSTVVVNSVGAATADATSRARAEKTAFILTELKRVMSLLKQRKCQYP